jgi:hypothetical protein
LLVPAFVFKMKGMNNINYQNHPKQTKKCIQKINALECWLDSMRVFRDIWSICQVLVLGLILCDMLSIKQSNNQEKNVNTYKLMW